MKKLIKLIRYSLLAFVATIMGLVGVNKGDKSHGELHSGSSGSESVIPIAHADVAAPTPGEPDAPGSGGPGE